MKTTKVLLTRKWSDWGAGDVVELEAEKAKRVIAKGYGNEFKEPKLEKRPQAETATMKPQAETAELTPDHRDKVASQKKKGGA